MVILLVLLLALILGGLGFAIHVLWWIALVVLVIWLLGFAVRMGEALLATAGTAGNRPRPSASPGRCLDAGQRRRAAGLRSYSQLPA